MIKEAKWIMSRCEANKSGRSFTCSGCGFVCDEFKKVCPSCDADMGYTVKRRMKYKCGLCGGLFENFAWRYDYSPSGDDISFCPLCGCEEPIVEEIWENKEDEGI